MDPNQNSGGQASRLLNDLVGEGMGEPQRSGTVLPRIKLVLPSSQAPVGVRRKSVEKAEAPLREVLPKIIQEVSRSAEAQPEAAQSEAAPEPSPAKPAVPAPASSTPPVKQEAGQDAGSWSRIRRRYAKVFGVRPQRLGREGRRFLAEGPIDRLIYSESDAALGAKPVHLIPPAMLAWAMLLPALIAFALLSWLPMARTVVMSLQQVAPTGAGVWVGAANYERAFADPVFLKTLANAALFTLTVAGAGFVLPLALALVLNERPLGGGWIRLALFLPFLTPTVPAVAAWRWIFDQGYGLANSLLAMAGFPQGVPWLNHPTLALLSVAAVFLWKNIGWNALIYQAALQGVPEELYETAEMEGASPWARLRLVTLPHLRGTMAFLLVMLVVGSLQVFSEVYLLTGGGPALSTEMIVTYLYKRSFLYLDLGYASAMAVMLFAFLFAFTTWRLRRIEEETV